MLSLLTKALSTDSSTACTVAAYRSSMQFHGTSRIVRNGASALATPGKPLSRAPGLPVEKGRPRK